MGSSDWHDRSTTFPWVAARTVQLVYALSDLLGSVVLMVTYLTGVPDRLRYACYRLMIICIGDNDGC